MRFGAYMVHCICVFLHLDIMHFEDSNNKISPFAGDLCQRLIDAGLLEDDPKYYGSQIIDWFGFDQTQSMAEYLDIAPENLSEFVELYMMGEGNCPLCGGELKFCETEGYEYGGSYDIPPEWIVTNYVYKCANCGEIIKTEEEL